MSEMWIDSAILRFETSTSIFSGIWRLADHGERAADLLQDAAVGHADGLSDQHHRHVDHHVLVHPDFEEVDVEDVPVHRVLLVVLKRTVRASLPETSSLITVLNLCGVAMALTSASGSMATIRGCFSNRP